MRPTLTALATTCLLLATSCTTPEEATPPPAAPTEHTEAPTTPETAVTVGPDQRLLCERLRLATAYRNGGQENEAQEQEHEALAEAAAGDAGPALQELAAAGGVGALVEWCRENTEPVNPTDPW